MALNKSVSLSVCMCARTVCWNNKLNLWSWFDLDPVVITSKITLLCLLLVTGQFAQNWTKINRQLVASTNTSWSLLLVCHTTGTISGWISQIAGVFLHFGTRIHQLTSIARNQSFFYFLLWSHGTEVNIKASISVLTKQNWTGTTYGGYWKNNKTITYF